MRPVQCFHSGGVFPPDSSHRHPAPGIPVLPSLSSSHSLPEEVSSIRSFPITISVTAHPRSSFEGTVGPSPTRGVAAQLRAADLAKPSSLEQQAIKKKYIYNRKSMLSLDLSMKCVQNAALRYNQAGFLTWSCSSIVPVNNGDEACAEFQSCRLEQP